MSEPGWQAPLGYVDLAELGEQDSLETEAVADGALDRAQLDGSQAWTSWDSHSSSSWSDDTDFTGALSYITGGTEPLSLADQLDATSDNTAVVGQEQHYNDGGVYSPLDIGWSYDSSDEADTRSWSPSGTWSDVSDPSVPQRVYPVDQAVPGTETNPVNHVAAIDLETLAAAGLLGGSTPTAACPSRPPWQIERGRGHLAPQNTGAQQVKVDVHMAGVTLATGTNTATTLAEATVAATTLDCPLCKRVCEDHRHRLGLHWRTLGYNGPPYCARCASVFRAHIIRRDVSADWCSRGKPCRSCSTVLHHFDKEALEDACRRIDEKTSASDAKRDLLMQTRGGKAMATAPCPYCRKTVAKSSMGLLWRKFGYSGQPYCSECATQFRKHIVRQSRSRVGGINCVRDKPCPSCRAILENFGDPTGTQTSATTFALLDSKTRAPVLNKASGQAMPKGNRRVCINAAARAPAVASNGDRKRFKRHRGSSSGGSRHGSVGGQQERRGPAGSLLAMATSTLTTPMLVAVGIALCMCGIGGLGMIVGSGSPPASPISTTAWGEGCEDGELSVAELQALGRKDRFRFESCCGSSQPPAWADFSTSQLISGAAAPPLVTDSMNSQLLDGRESDAKGQGGPYHSCWAGRPMRCYPLCLGYCIALSTVTSPGQIKDDQYAVARVRHDTCVGPLGSTCMYDCISMYEPVGELRCLPGSSTYQGGTCQQKFQQGPGLPQLPPRPKPDWMENGVTPTAEPAEAPKVSQQDK